MSEAEAIWELAVDRIRWRIWDDIVVVYCDTSGHTHEFGEFEGWIFERLAERSYSHAELLTIARTIEADADANELDARLRQAVGLFARCDLIRAATPGPGRH